MCPVYSGFNVSCYIFSVLILDLKIDCYTCDPLKLNLVFRSETLL